MPKLSSSTLATGARQLVVQEALEMMSCLAVSYISSLTPRQTVMSGSLAGAEMMTFFAPASRCLAAAARSVKSPVDSITTSTPSSPHGSSAGSLSAVTRTRRPSMTSASSWISTSPGKTPWTESYLSRWASVLASVRSLTADELDVGALPQGRAEDEPADAAEAVDTYAHAHLNLPLGSCGNLPPHGGGQTA